MIDLRKIFGREFRSKMMYALKFLPDKMYLNIFYFSTTGRFINFKNPKGFNEKQQWLKVNDASYPDEYGWLAMNYVLPLANTNVAVEFSLYDGTREEGDDLLCSYEVPNVTVTENYRTHLLGEVLTTLGTINVIIEPAFDNEIVEGI